MLVNIKELSDHMYWADSKVWSEIKKISQDSNIQTILDLVYHLHSVQYAYLCIWKKESLASLPKNEFKDIVEITVWGETIHNQFRTFLKSLDDIQLNNSISIPWTKRVEKKIGRPAEKVSLLQSINQVILHSTYHRGQINTKIRELGGEPPLTDFIYWIWINKFDAEKLN